MSKSNIEFPNSEDLAAECLKGVAECLKGTIMILKGVDEILASDQDAQEKSKAPVLPTVED